MHKNSYKKQYFVLGKKYGCMIFPFLREIWCTTMFSKLFVAFKTHFNDNRKLLIKLNPGKN